MSVFKITTKGFKSFERALKRNPQNTKRELGDFFVDAMRIYNKGVIRNPWKVGGRGGGAPVDTGNLRDRHRREISTWSAKIFVNPSEVNYALAVHKGRPWLDSVFKTSMSEVNKRADKLLDNITNDLAK